MLESREISPTQLELGLPSDWEMFEELSATQRLKLVHETGDNGWISKHVDGAIGGVNRALNRRSEFKTASRLPRENKFAYNESWTVVFVADKALYTVHHDEVIRPTDHYFTESFILERHRDGIINEGIFCSIPANDGEKAHIWPKAEIILGGKEPLIGIPALLAMDEAFPELGLVWQNVAIKDQSSDRPS